MSEQAVKLGQLKTAVGRAKSYTDGRLTEVIEAVEADMPTSLPADGGNADTVSNHTVAADVPADAKFTDTVYNDTEIKKSVSGTASDLATHKADTTVHVTAADKAAWNGKAELSDIPTSLPANGGNAATVNGLTVQTAVPANAKFTDTVYSLPTATGSVLGGVKTGTNITNTSGTISLTKANVTGALGYTPPTTNTTYSAATATAAGLVSTGAQTFAGNKTFNGQILPNGATASGTPQARKLASGTAAASTTNCPNGAWYGQHS